MSAIHSYSTTLVRQNLAQAAVIGATYYFNEYAAQPLDRMIVSVGGFMGRVGLEFMRMSTLHQMTKTVFSDNKALHVATRPDVQLAFGTLAMGGAMYFSFTDAPKTATALSALAAAPRAIGALTLANAARQLSTNNEALGTKNGLILLANLADQAYWTYRTYRTPAIFRDIFEQAVPTTNTSYIPKAETEDQKDFTDKFLKFARAEKCPPQIGCPNLLKKARLSPPSLWEYHRCVTRAIVRDFPKQAVDTTNTSYVSPAETEDQKDFTDNFLKFARAEKSPSQTDCPHALEREISSPFKLWDAYRCTKKRMNPKVNDERNSYTVSKSI